MFLTPLFFHISFSGNWNFDQNFLYQTLISYALKSYRQEKKLEKKNDKKWNEIHITNL